MLLFSTAGITALSALFSVFLVQGPKTKAEVAQTNAKIELDELDFRLDVLHTALASDKPEVRKTSLHLFIGASLLDSTLLQYVATVGNNRIDVFTFGSTSAEPSTCGRLKALYGR